MLSIGRAIVSMDLLEKRFICDLDSCKGYCCYDGDSGAPLEEEEAKILKEIYPKIKSYMRPEGVTAIEKQGTSVIDSDGDTVTPLIGAAECAYTFIEDGVYKCAIEKAWVDKKIKYRKPESCHLFPVRIKRYNDFDAVNYEELKICKPALALGKAKEVYVYQFLKEPLIRVYGKDWYKELTIAAQEIEKRAKKKRIL
jgi:hypothetical protein